MKHYYKSKISIPLWIGIWGFVFALNPLSFKSDYSIQRILDSPLASLTWIFFILILGTVFFGTGYLVKKRTLIIKIGPITERKIEIQDIQSIERSYEMIASPANAFKRLKIDYKGGEVLISPAREKEFIKRLKSINPDIEIFNLQKSIKF